MASPDRERASSIGAFHGSGLASRHQAWGYGAKTLGVFSRGRRGDKTASEGNTTLSVSLACANDRCLPRASMATRSRMK